MTYFVRVNGETLHNNPSIPSHYVAGEPPQHPRARFNYAGFCLERGIIRIGWPDTGDLSQPDKTGALAKGYNLSSLKLYIQEYLLTFRDIEVGSVILMPDTDRSGDFYMGEVTLAYHYFHALPDEPYECAHRLGVSWDKDVAGRFQIYRADEVGIETQGGGFWRRAFRALDNYDNSRVVIPHLREARQARLTPTKV